MPDDAPQAPRSFEDMLADPNEQFGGRSEFLASIAGYAAAPPATAGVTIGAHDTYAPNIATLIAAERDQLRDQLRQAEAERDKWQRTAERLEDARERHCQALEQIRDSGLEAHALEAIASDALAEAAP